MVHHRFSTRFISCFFALMLSVCLLTSCAMPLSQNQQTNKTDQPTLTRYSTVFFDYFDTVTTVIAYCENEETFQTQMDALASDLSYYHQLYDIYHTYDGITNLATLNATASTAPVAVNDDIWNLLTTAKELYTLTDGAVNIAMGTVFSLWHEERTLASTDPDHAKLPNPDALQTAALHCNLDDVILDAEQRTVFFADPDLQLDVGSCGKGYACEQIAQNAAARGVTSMLMSIGGNLRSIGTKPDDTPWTGGIENPWAMANGETENLCALQLTDMALVVSGDYQRYYTVDGVRYHHLIDPDTLYPATYYNSVSVLCPDAGLADCLSTALFCMPLEQGQALIESLDNAEALWCLTDGKTVIFSSGFEPYQSKE